MTNKHLEKLVEKKLNNYKLVRKYQANYKDFSANYLWTLGKKLQNPEQVKNVCYSIATFFNENDNYLSVDIAYLISDVVIIGNTIFIYTSHPGLLIGKGGSLIDSLKDRINENSNIKYKINLIEDLYSNTAIIRSFTRRIV